MVSKEGSLKSNMSYVTPRTLVEIRQHLEDTACSCSAGLRAQHHIAKDCVLQNRKAK